MNNEKQKIAVEVNHVSKSFHIPIEGSSGIKQKLINSLKGKKGYRVFTPLNDVSFTINKGDFFGIVGKNGSGKSTLLKTIAGIYSPNKGDVVVNGTLVPFIELGVGFNPELTGRENIFLNGSLLGFSHKEVETMYSDIVEFAELGDFMEERLKNYSSGMQVRLAFSIAIQAKGDILLLDEVLAVGDAAFQQKCFDYLYQLKKDKKTVIFVSHDMSAVERFCNRAIYLKDGLMVAQGRPDAIGNRYFRENFQNSQSSKSKQKSNDIESEYVNGLVAAIVDKKEFYGVKDKLDVSLTFNILKKSQVILKMAILKDGLDIAQSNSKHTLVIDAKPGEHKATLSVDLKDLIKGRHELNWGVFDNDSDKMLSLQIKAADFLIENNDDTKSGLFSVDTTWGIEN